MFLHELEIKQFRCFEKRNFVFQKSITLITGDNGTGKTSLAEAIHYLCYMKSFRSNALTDLICHEHNSFFLKGSFTSAESLEDVHSIQVGYSNKKKAIKIDGKIVTTYKSIFNLFQVITLLEDDINLIKGYPSGRRSFVDQAVLFYDAKYLDVYRNFKKIVQSRNALLHQNSIEKIEFEVWAEKLWESSLKIQQRRIDVLKRIEGYINILLKKYFDDEYQVQIKYEAKSVLPNETFNMFYQRMSYIFRQEQLYKRSMFGAHLDDFIVKFKGKNARNYASRGQQKLISLLCKLSLITLANERSYLPILVIDDFIADFDQKRLQNIINFLLSCKNQIIITTPFYASDLQKLLERADPEVISMNF